MRKPTTGQARTQAARKKPALDEREKAANEFAVERRHHEEIVCLGHAHGFDARFIEVAAEFPDVALDHILVDNCAMQLILNPRRFDILVTENMFGDILSDEGAVLAGSIGMLPSASIGDQKPSGAWVGLYEPVHGSAPDIAGQNKANPFGAIGSVAAMLEYSFGLKEEAAAVNRATEAVLNSGRVTADLKPAGKPATTEEVGDRVTQAI